MDYYYQRAFSRGGYPYLFFFIAKPLNRTLIESSRIPRGPLFVFKKKDTGSIELWGENDGLFEELPYELIWLVVSFMDFHSLMNMIQVSKFWNSIGTDETFWEILVKRYCSKSVLEPSSPIRGGEEVNSYRQLFCRWNEFKTKNKFMERICRETWNDFMKIIPQQEIRFILVHFMEEECTKTVLIHWYPETGPPEELKTTSMRLKQKLKKMILATNNIKIDVEIIAMTLDQLLFENVKYQLLPEQFPQKETGRSLFLSGIKHAQRREVSWC